MVPRAGETLGKVVAPVYENPGHVYIIKRARDGRQRQVLSDRPFLPACYDAAIQQREDGQYELFAGYWVLNTFDIWRYVSDDGVNWQQPQRLVSLPAKGNLYKISATRAEGCSLLTLVKSNYDTDEHSLLLLRNDGRGEWQQSREIPLFGKGRTAASFTFHPRWGYILAWMKASSGSSGMFMGSVLDSGPRIIRGSSVDSFFAPAAAPKSEEAE